MDQRETIIFLVSSSGLIPCMLVICASYALCTQANMRTHAHTHTHTHTHTHIHTHIHAHTHTHTRTYTHTHTRTYIHTHIYTHIHTHIHAHAYVHKRVLSLTVVLFSHPVNCKCNNRRGVYWKRRCTKCIRSMRPRSRVSQQQGTH